MLSLSFSAVALFHDQRLVGLKKKMMPLIVWSVSPVSVIGPDFQSLQTASDCLTVL